MFNDAVVASMFPNLLSAEAVNKLSSVTELSNDAVAVFTEEVNAPNEPVSTNPLKSCVVPLPRVNVIVSLVKDADAKREPVAATPTEPVNAVSWLICDCCAASTAATDADIA